MQHPTCTIPGCDKPLRSPGSSRSKGAVWCAMHYHRWYRHGDPNITANATDVTASHGRRYQSIYKPGHPLASKRGMVYAHRAVLYDTIGLGPHHCHWCNTEVQWAPKGTPGELQPDHLNNIGDDNRPENLVPACRRCNSTRGSQRRSRALRNAGWWSNNDTIAVLAGRRPPVEAA